MMVLSHSDGHIHELQADNLSDSIQDHKIMAQWIYGAVFEAFLVTAIRSPVVIYRCWSVVLANGVCSSFSQGRDHCAPELNNIIHIE